MILLSYHWKERYYFINKFKNIEYMQTIRKFYKYKKLLILLYTFYIKKTTIHTSTYNIYNEDNPNYLCT